MSAKEQSVRMIRRNLAGIPEPVFPAGFSLRWYRAGDRETWVRVQRKAERILTITPELFDREFARDEASLARRQAFLLDDHANEIGTATAWFNLDYHGERFGRIHWVAVASRFQGKGLAKPLLAAVCQRLAELGHDRAYLVTSTARLPAISLYLKFGFEPDIRDADQRQVWEAALAELGRLGRTKRD